MSKYNPMSKEFQEEAKRLGLTGYQYMQKLIQKEKIKNPSDVEQKRMKEFLNKHGFKDRTAYNDYLAKNKGFENHAELSREWYYECYGGLVLSENPNCSSYLGIFIAERKYGRKILPLIFGEIKREMPYGNRWYDFIVKGGLKIDIKSATLSDNKWTFPFHIRYNDVADYFILIAFDNRIDLNCLHIWLIKKDEIIRGEVFCYRDKIKITNKEKPILKFRQYEITNKIKELKEGFLLVPD